MRTLQSIPFFDHYDAATRTLRLRGASRIPDELFEFHDQIEILDASQGSLTALPDKFSTLRQLRIAFFSQNRFTELPSVLGECENLDIIGFKSCQICCVPEDSLPRNLQWLILTDNHISRLPDSIGRLSKLRKLALAGNQLNDLPEAMAECVSLELIRLGANDLTRPVPEWLFQLPRLSWFCDSGNPALEKFVPRSSPVEIDRKALRFGNRIGGSPTSDVFKGTIISTGEQVAIKEYRGVLTSDGYAADDMRASIAIGAHPCLIEVIGKILADDKHAECLVLKLVPKEVGSLGLPPTFDTCTRDTFPENSCFSLSFILNVLSDIGAALHHMHERAITHGDLYAHNILSDGKGRSILGDFGAASFFDPADRLRRLVEVRAFGCLIDDLLQRLAPGSAGAEYDRLKQLRGYCMNPEISARPSANEIRAFLRQLIQYN